MSILFQVVKGKWKGIIDLNNLSLEQLAGQRLMVGFEGTALSASLKDLIARLYVGGVILFSRNIESPAQLKNLCFSIQEYAQSIGQPPLLIAIDQEGGAVARLKPPFTVFSGNPAIGLAGEQAAIDFAETTAKELRRCGVNINFAPVMDVAPLVFDSVMKERIFSCDPEVVAYLGCTIIQHLQKNGIAACAKHFPGIGRTTLDSHKDLPLLDKSRSELEGFELLPFQAAVHAEVSSIMLSHVLYVALDREWPASISLSIAYDLLRCSLGFKGVVITDDLDMGAITGRFDIDTAVRQALAADVDIVLICHSRPKMEAAYKTILSCIRNGLIYKDRFTPPIQRILDLKSEYIVKA
ncbi:MAG: beta-N-acetylhexosaminidase [Pseudomonadota bacterium]